MTIVACRTDPVTAFERPRDPRRRPVQILSRLSAGLGLRPSATSRSTASPGEIFGLLGPNGAGKTTTLRILSTVLKPTGGRAVVAGHDVVAEPQAVRSSIGYMSASTGIYDRMTAWELVEYFGRLYGLHPRPAPASGWRRSSTG